MMEGRYMFVLFVCKICYVLQHRTPTKQDETQVTISAKQVPSVSDRNKMIVLFTL